MKLEIRREYIAIVPENELEHAYIEDVLGIKQDGATITFRRVNEQLLGYVRTDDVRFALVSEKSESKK